jgi:AcrR family transcriptional regulator
MRVTAQTKAATRKSILGAARRLFSQNGYEATTTRDIARAAQIASGTLFNYFQTKEAIVACLANEAIGDALAQARHTAHPAHSAHEADTLEEDLFALVAGGLRKLKQLRKHLPSLLETTLSPLALTSQKDSASFRAGHLEAVAALAGKHGYRRLSPVALQLYWSLYTGVLVFWANDRSPRQEDTLALVDDSVHMFVGWLGEPTPTDSADSADLTGDEP